MGDGDNQIIINEVLCYVSNRIDVLEEPIINRICTSNFSEKEIEEAKTIICGHLSIRNTARKGDGRSAKHVQDIIKILKETEPNNLPILVAKDLHKIPPITFDHLDVTKILKELVTLKSEIFSLKTEMVRQEEILGIKEDIRIIKTEVNSIPKPFCKGVLSTNEERDDIMFSAGSLLSSARAPTAAVAAAAAPPRLDTAQAQASALHDAHESPGRLEPNVWGPSALTPVETGEIQLSQFRASYRDIAANKCVSPQRKQNAENVDKDGFTLVTRQKRKSMRKNMRGKGEENDLLQAAPTTSSIYLSRVRLNITEEKLAEYIAKKGESVIKIEYIKPYRPTNFNTYVVTVDADKLKIFMSATFWPPRIVYRKYIHTNSGPRQSNKSKYV